MCHFPDKVNALEKSQVGAKHSGSGQNNVAGSVNTWNGQLLTEIPDQVSDSVKSVESKWESHSSLRQHLHGNRQGSKCGHKGGGVEGNRQERSGGVSTSQGVKSSSHGNTGDSVDTRQVPGQLWLVDGQVGRHWTVFSLCYKDLILLFVADLDGGGVSH